MKEVKISDIYADHDFNCRETGSVTNNSVSTLAQSMKRHGLLQPIVVHPFNQEGKKYRIIAGHRRFVAASSLGWETIPAIIDKEINTEDPKAMYLNLIENIERKNLHIVDEALSISKMCASGISLAEASRELSQSVAWVKLRFDMLSVFTEKQLLAIRERGDKFKQTSLRQLVQIKDPEERIKKLREVLETIDRGGKGTNVRILKKKKNMSDCRERRADEINSMLEFLMDHVGSGLATRCLAWAAGTITDGDIIDEVKKVCTKFNVPFNLPEAYKK